MVAWRVRLFGRSFLAGKIQSQEDLPTRSQRAGLETRKAL